MTTQAEAPIAQIRPGEAARRLGVEPSTLRKWVAEGLVEPTTRTAGGESRFSEEDLAKLVERYRASGGLMLRPVGASPAPTDEALACAPVSRREQKIELSAIVCGLIFGALALCGPAVYAIASKGEPPHAVSLVAYANEVGADEILMFDNASPIFYRDGQVMDVNQDWIVGSKKAFHTVKPLHLAQLDVGREECGSRRLAGEQVQVCPIENGMRIRLDD